MRRKLISIDNQISQKNPKQFNDWLMELKRINIEIPASIENDLKLQEKIQNEVNSNKLLLKEKKQKNILIKSVDDEKIRQSEVILKNRIKSLKEKNIQYEKRETQINSNETTRVGIDYPYQTYLELIEKIERL